jgi:chitin synthase
VFFFLAQPGEDPSKNPFGKYQEIYFAVLRGLYVIAVITIVICSLGNRPQGSKWIYLCCIWLFMVIMAALLYLGGYQMYQFYRFATASYQCCKTKSLGEFDGFDCKNLIETNPCSQSNTNFAQVLFATPGFTDLVIAFVSTYGLYVFQSILYFDPWHMITSCVQYLLFLPSNVNILNVYACKLSFFNYIVCNLHDVSWGTKGDNKAESLGGATVVKGKDGKATVSLDIPTERKDINANYDIFVREIQAPRPKASSTPDAKTKQDDYFRSFRTNVVLFWFFCNAILIVALTNQLFVAELNKRTRIDVDGQSNTYLKFIFYSVAGLGAIRFVGSTLYLLSYYVFG